MSYKVVQIDGKYAIVDENERMVSPKFDFISPFSGLPKNQSPYYIAGNLVYTDNPEKELIAFEKDGKWVTPRYAIFDKDGNMISPQWFKLIDSHGLVKGEGEIYVAIREDGKWAVYDVNGKQVSPEEFDVVIPLVFLEKEAEGKYLAVKDDKMAIFDLDGNQLTEWQKLKTDFTDFLEMFKKEIAKIATIGLSADRDEAKPKTSQKIEGTVYIASENKWVNVKYYENLGILEISNKQGNSTAIELTYKDDLDLKKGPNTPGV
jgi:hypothetical protein